MLAWICCGCVTGPVLLQGCTLASDKRTVYHYTPDYGVDSAEFRRSLDAFGTRLLPGNHVRLLENGDEFFPDMLEAIRGAQRSINLEMYIFTADETGREFARAMASRARAGVSVRLLVDGVGSKLDWLGDMMRLAGAQVEIYKPLRLYTILKVSQRSHRKILTVDGRIGYVGGMGIDDRWRGNARNPHEWRDAVIRLEGPVVSQLQAIFMEDWMQTTGEVLHGNDQFPALQIDGGVLAQAVRSSGSDPNSMSKLLYYMAIQAAQRRIWIQNAYFVPDRQIVAALLAAVKRGVDVEVMVPGRHTDLQFVRMASRFLYGQLLDGGVHLYEYQPTMLHNKVMVIDGIWTTIGSINFVSRSMRKNTEANVAVYDPVFAARVEQSFRVDLEHCTTFRKRRWEKRGPLLRLAEVICWLFSDAY